MDDDRHKWAKEHARVQAELDGAAKACMAKLQTAATSEPSRSSELQSTLQQVLQATFRSLV